MAVFYQLPARFLVDGVSLDTGVEVNDVYFPDYGGYVQFTTRVRGQENSGDTLLYREDDLVSLAVFSGTRIDLSHLDEACNVRTDQ